MTDVVLNYPDTIELGERVENVCSEALTFLFSEIRTRSDHALSCGETLSGTFSKL